MHLTPLAARPRPPTAPRPRHPLPRTAQGANHRLLVDNLEKAVDPAKCKFRVKENKVRACALWLEAQVAHRKHRPAHPHPLNTPCLSSVF